MAKEISLVDLLDDFNSPQDVRCDRALAILEREARRRWSLEGLDDPHWFASVSRELLASDRTSSPQLRVEILLLIAQWAHKQGRLDEGLAVAQKALNVACAAQASALQRRTWAITGVLHFAVTDFAEASICFVNALNIANQLGDRLGKCAALANLAAARLEAGLIDESIKLNEYVIDLAEDDPVAKSMRIDAHHNVALASRLLGDSHAALDHVETAFALLSEPTNKFDAYKRTAMELTFTKVLIEEGQLDRAEERAKLAGHYAEKLDSRGSRIQAEFARILCDAVKGRSDIALTRLAEIQAQVLPGEPAFRDYLEVELLCNRQAGRQQYARYYTKMHLSNLAEAQRQMANRQIGTIKKSLSPRASVQPADIELLPVALRRAFSSSQRVQELVRKQLETLAMLTALREEPAGQHSMRCGRVARLLALEVGYSEKDAEALEVATRLHDIGKLAIPDVILLKRGRLSATESEIMRRHPIEGCQMLNEIVAATEALGADRRKEADGLRLAAQIAAHHHEWWDGTGYPRGTAGEAIPEPARIAAVADVLDELTHTRPYRARLGIDDALAQIEALSGRQFEPRLCEALRRIVSSGRVNLLDDQVQDPLPFVAANKVLEHIIDSIGLQRTAPRRRKAAFLPH